MHLGPADQSLAYHQAPTFGLIQKDLALADYFFNHCVQRGAGGQVHSALNKTNSIGCKEIEHQAYGTLTQSHQATTSSGPDSLKCRPCELPQYTIAG